MIGAENRIRICEVLDMIPDRIVLSNLSDKTYVYRKTIIHKYVKKNNEMYQIERYTDKQVFHENVSLEEISEIVLGVFPDVYKQLNIFMGDREWNFKITKKGKILSNTSRHSNIFKSNTHNRKKNYILQEGLVIPPLIDLGIFTKDGQVVRSMYDKYKQINRFIEMVDDVVKNYKWQGKNTFNAEPDNQYEMNIIDFGCGKSYLTFILYYYLVEIKGMRVNMTGLDLKADVIEKCNATAKKYHYDNLHFELGDINGYKTDKHVDMVVTLHACDTATDYALYNAICWNADIILSVPCCQHELNAQIESSDYSILTRYGIVKERVSALMTDAIRANVLEYCGYNTQLLEFIDIAHSPKNILIRAVRRRGERVIEAQEYVEGKNEDGEISGSFSDDRSGSGKNMRGQKAWAEAERLCEEFHIKQTLMELVK